jgi:PIN domain nuclease of toxin-antitoxin system
VARVIYLDTHVIAWLYGLGATALSEAAAAAVEAADEIRISPMVRLELQYLHEIGRLSEPPIPVLDALQATLGLSICTAPFPAVVRAAEMLSWTRDPFDRLIVAQAGLHDAPLVTKDSVLHRHYPACIW